VGDFNGDNLSDYAVGVSENMGGTDSGSVFCEYRLCGGS